MKNTKHYILAGALALVAILITANIWPVNAASVGYFQAGQPVQVVGANSSAAALNTVTNGYYPASIGSGVTTNNLVLVNCSAPATILGGGSANGVLSGNSLALQFTASATATTGATNTATFVLYGSVQPPVISTGGTNGAAYNSNTMQLFDTITLALSGTSVVTSNKVYTIGTTPAKGALPYVYVYSIGCATGATLTNYSVWASSN